ncbi:hypothetical protein [Nonomuraea jabiensis]
MIKSQEIAETAQDAWDAFVELRACGFSEEEALKLVGIVLMHVNRKGLK